VPVSTMQRESLTPTLLFTLSRTKVTKIMSDIVLSDKVLDYLILFIIQTFVFEEVQCIALSPCCMMFA